MKRKKYSYKNILLKQAVSEKLSEFQKEFRKHMVVFITGAFSFVAALTWNDAIREAISMISLQGSVLFVKFLTAIIVSAVAIIAIIFVTKVLRV